MLHLLPKTIIETTSGVRPLLALILGFMGWGTLFFLTRGAAQQVTPQELSRAVEPYVQETVNNGLDGFTSLNFSWPFSLSVPEQASVFVELNRPVGIATDGSDNIYVMSDDTLALRLSKFDATRRELKRVPVGNITSSELIGHLAVDSQTGNLFVLSSSGFVGVFNADLQLLGEFNIRTQTPLRTDSVYDLTTQRHGNFSGQIVSSLANFGDIALRRGADQIDIFVTGVSVATPFVARVSFSADLQQLREARVLVASIAAGAGSNNVPRGVAVNAAGTVLTTLPIANNIGTYDVAVTFRADFPQGGQAPQILFNRADLSSRGLTSDAAGNFYVATGPIGASSCGAGGSGALVIIPASLAQAACLPFGTALADSNDVAVNRNASVAYITFNNAVIQIPLNNPSNPQQQTVIPLTSGQSQQDQVSPPTPPATGQLGATQYSIQVPENTAQLRLQLSGNQPAALIGRYGQPVGLTPQGQLQADFVLPPDQPSASITQTLTPASTPSLRTGTLYLAIGNFGAGTLSYTLTATLGGSSACTYTLSAPGQSFTASGGSGSVNVTTQSGCPWTATKTDAWITINAGANGSGSGQVSYTVAANTSTGQRTGTLTIAGQSYTVTQAGTGGGGGDTTEELKTDDGQPEVGGRVDGGAVVNRLTPTNFPARLERIRIGISQFQDAPNPTGQTIQLLYAVSAATQPPPQAQFTKMSVTVPGINNFFDFPVQNGPTIPAGSHLYVGYQAPTPNAGVGFIFDVNGQRQDRTFILGQDGLTFLGPVPPDTGQTAFNALIRVVVSSSGASGGTPTLSVAPNSLDFGQVNVGVSASRQITLRNIGTATLILNSIVSDNAQFHSGLSVSNFSLAPGGLLEGSITFMPSGAGMQQGRLLIQSSDPAQSAAMVTLRGEGLSTQPACPTISGLSPSNGPLGATVTLNGANFTGVTQVRFGGNATALFNVNGAGTQITTTVPTNAQSGPIMVSKPNCPDAQSSSFTVAVSCSYALSSSAQNFPADGGSGNVGVSAANGCNWTAASNANFITINSGATGSGSGNVSYSVAANVSTSVRSGTLTIAGQTFTVTQAGGTVATNRIVRVQDASGTPGDFVRVPIVIEAQGDEVGVQFSLNYNAALLSEPQAEAGSDATNNQFFDVNATQAGQGRLGVLLLLRSALARGTRQLAVVRFRIAANAPAGQPIPVAFGDEPTRRRVIDINTNALDANYQAGTVTLSAGFEGDVNDDKAVDILDAQLILNHLTDRRRINAGAEFQRADCAPKGTKGDGTLDISDVRQALIYATTNELNPVGGPTAPSGLLEAFDWRAVETLLQPMPRVVRLAQVNGMPGEVVRVPILLEAQGEEAGLQFTLNFDPQQLSYLQAEAGSDAANNQFFDVNLTQAAQGRLGVLLLLRNGLASGTRQLVVVSFRVAANATAAALSFGNEPTRQRLIDLNANALNVSFTNGNVTLIQPVASVSAASYNPDAALASEAIAAAFGQTLATRIEVAASVPLPTTLAGTTVRLRDSAGVERMAPLFFVAPNQINYQVPAGMMTGTATVTVTNGAGALSSGTVNLVVVAPGLFTANANGQGVPAAVALRIKANGSLSYEAVARFDAAQNRFLPIPLDLGEDSDQLFLILYGTGLRNVASLQAVTATMGGLNADVLFVGAAEGFIGLEQINLRVPRSLTGRGEVSLQVTADGRRANPVTLSIR